MAGPSSRPLEISRERVQAMAAAKKRATLASGLLDAEAAGLVDKPGARRARRSEPKRPVLLGGGAEAATEKSQVPDRAAEAAARQALLAKGGAFFERKGAASAATFKPWYWTYDEEKERPAAPAQSPAPVVALLPPPQTPAQQIAALREAFAVDPGKPVFPFEVPRAPTEPPATVAEIIPPAPSVPVAEDAETVEVRRHRTAFAEQLSAIIESILATREFAALAGLRSSYTREEQQAKAGAAGLPPAPNAEISHASLRAELEKARPRQETAQQPARSQGDRLLYAGCAIMVIAAVVFTIAI